MINLPRTFLTGNNMRFVGLIVAFCTLQSVSEDFVISPSFTDRTFSFDVSLGVFKEPIKVTEEFKQHNILM